MSDSLSSNQCGKCGAHMEWVDCYEFDCDEGSYHDCGEDCCCCADPMPNRHCSTCRGKGGWFVCGICHPESVDA
jgi:hypothetical protein